jgi:chorismate mutase
MKKDENQLSYYRSELGKIDSEIIDLLVKRFDYACVINIYKKMYNIPIVNADLRDYIRDKYAQDLGHFGKEIYDIIHNCSALIQNDESTYIQVRRSKNKKS